MLNIRKKWIVIAVCLAVLLSVGTGFALSYITRKTPPIANTLEPGRVECVVNESFDGNVKNNVTVKNTGNTSAYIRASVVANWQSKTDAYEIFARAPQEGVDYSITLGDPLWVMGGDGYWYYTYPVPCAKDTQVVEDVLTEILISRVELLENAMAPAGYTLSVEIVASAIQAEPITAATENWGLTVDQNGVITSVKAGGEAA
jgi:hypothetical protein